MRMVRQDDPQGSGLACIAMVIGQPYAAVRARALKSKRWRPYRGMGSWMLKDLLRGYRRAVRYTSREAKPSGTAIVSIVFDEQPDRRHFVVWRDGKIYDPDGCQTLDGFEEYLDDVTHTGFWFWIEATIVHGTASAYSNQKCRCFECRVAWSRYTAGLRDKRTAAGICIECREPRYLHYRRCQKHHQRVAKKNTTTRVTTRSRNNRQPNAEIPHRGAAAV